MVANETFKTCLFALRQPQIKKEKYEMGEKTYIKLCSGRNSFFFVLLFPRLSADVFFSFSFRKNLNCSYMFSDIKFNEAKSRNKQFLPRL